MTIKSDVIHRYIHQITVEKLSEEYKQKGFNVTTEEQIGNYRADLIARKGDETIVFEVKSKPLNSEMRKRITALSDYINKNKNYKFKVVIANPPVERNIEIENIESLLFDELVNNFPDELDELSSHTSIIEVMDVVIQEIVIKDNNEIYVKGDGAVGVELQMGSGSDNDNDLGYRSSDSFSMSFALLLEYNYNQNLVIKKILSIQIDTSSFYE